ncbi:MAG: T9SS type A sorting domain-containing protein, partial [Candidatus Cloacimonadia bacterium]
PGLDGAIITARKENEFYNIRVVENGSVTMYLEPETTGIIEITATKPNYLPLIDSINVVIEPIDIGLYEFEMDKSPNPGEEINIAITLKNYGSQEATSVSAELTTNNPFVNLTDSIANYGSIGSGETAIQNYQFEILSQCPDSQILEFTLIISDGSTAKFEILVSGLVFEVQEVIVIEDDNGILDPGEGRELLVSIKNIGSLGGNELTGVLNSSTDAVEITDSTGNFGTIAPGETGTTNFAVYAKPDCYIGRNIPFNLELASGNGLIALVQFSLEIGEADNTAPTGPDNFGYFAYDSYDEGYDECPEYCWYEIDPEQGGTGSVALLDDDCSVTIPLPFSFTYYDEAFDSVTICSNGWISFKPTWMTNFRNWNIPAALGPYAMVAPFWDDLIGANEEKMRLCYNYAANEDIFIIEWNNCVNNYDEESIEKFQVILFNPQTYPTIDGNGEVQFNYHTVSNPDAVSNYATVGIENLDQSDGVLYTYANIYPQSATQLQNNLAIKFTTDPPDNYYGINNPPTLSSTIKLYQTSPNPFSTSTTISFSIPPHYKDDAEIEIYNIKGQRIRELKIENLKLKINEVVWDGKDAYGKQMPSGIYFAKLSLGEESAVKKMILIR